MFDENVFNKYLAIQSYLKGNKKPMHDLMNEYPEFEKIDLFIKIAEAAYNHFKETKYCSFEVEGDDFFSLIDCTFKGYDDAVYIMSENPDICDFPMLMFDHSCMLYIYVPEDFDEDPEKYKDEFIESAIYAVYENYVTVLKEDTNGLTGKSIPNPDYEPNIKMKT